MGRVIPFSEVEIYLEDLKRSKSYTGAIFDTNVLISATYDVRDSHFDVVQIWEVLRQNNYRICATINTRSEYLEFHRRLILTENLIDMTDEFSELKVPKAAKARIQTLRGSLRSSISADSERDEVFNENQLKKIKKEFSAGLHSGQSGWLQVCELFLKDQLENADRDLMAYGIEYISANEKSQDRLFEMSPDWPDAISICERTGTAFSDSMILNALKASRLSFVVTLDFDIGYAALSDSRVKDVLVPDRLYKEYKKYHFPTTR